MFIPHTESEKETMLHKIGVEHLEDLFADVPEELRFPSLNLPEPLSEMEAVEQAQELALANIPTTELACFLGAGAYNHYIPAVVDNILQRGDFYSAYTPYQPEVSQGTLQVIFEFQSLIASLTGMDVSNASHYDGATATAEAGVMAYHNYRGKRKRFILSPSVHPYYRETFRTYLSGRQELEITGDADKSGFQNPTDLIPLINEDTALVVVQYPDFFGRIFDYSELAKAVHEHAGLFAVVANPMALGLIKPPSAYDADIVVGEGQPLGIPLSYGGPYLGFFATKDEYLRRVSGRLVGATVDQNENKGYVLTLTAREQHIRRDKATSNICTNQGLMALASTVYLSALGKSGLKQVARLCYNKAHYAADLIDNLDGYQVMMDQPFFNEFVIKTPYPVEDINNHLLDHGILGGYDLSRHYPEMRNHMLVAVTEKNSREEIELLTNVLQEIGND